MTAAVIPFALMQPYLVVITTVAVFMGIHMEVQKKVLIYETNLLQDISNRDPEYESEIMVGMLEREEEIDHNIYRNIQITNALRAAGGMTDEDAKDSIDSLLFIGSEYVRVLDEIKNRQRFQSALLHWQFLVDKALIKAQRRLDEINEAGTGPDR